MKPNTVSNASKMFGLRDRLSCKLGEAILLVASLFLLYLTGTQLFGVKAARLTLAIATIIPIFQGRSTRLLP